MKKTSQQKIGSLSLSTTQKICNQLKRIKGKMSLNDYARLRYAQYKLGLSNHQTRKETREMLNVDLTPLKTKLTGAK